MLLVARDPIGQAEDGSRAMSMTRIHSAGLARMLIVASSVVLSTCGLEPGECANEGEVCQVVPPEVFESQGVRVEIRSSCTSLWCINRRCIPRSPRWNPKFLKPAIETALGKIFQETDRNNCMGEPVRGRMIEALLQDGVSIGCTPTQDTNGDGGPDCASAALGGNTMTLSSVGTSRCGSLATTLRHEMQHGAGAQGHTVRLNEDPVYGCDKACFESDRIGPETEMCR